MLLVLGLVLIIGSLQIHGGPMEEAPPVNYFLPDDITPVAYTVNINVTKSLTNGTSGPQSFEGEVTIIAITKKSLQTITLHAANMTNLKISVKNRLKEIYKKDSEKFNTVTETLSIDLINTISANEDLTINIKYTALLHTDMHGFYVSSYMEGKENKTVLTTQFQPTHARRAFPCFDEPKYKATFEINIAKPAKYNVLSNMQRLLVSNETYVRFPKTNHMSTYLVAFIVSEFVQTQGNEAYYNVWARPEARNQTIEAANAMKFIIDDLDKFTGIKYSAYMPKMDMAALPDFSAGAMENWGLLTYRETALLVDDKLSTNQNIQRVITVIAHEIAHQWFGNLVTLTWWNNTWINEGFARYFEYHTTAAYKPEWEMENQFVVEQHQSIFEVDALEKTTPLTHPVQTPGEINSHFGTISYSKGGSIIRMMEHFLTRDLFKAGLQAYLKKKAFGNAMPEDIWSSLEEKSKDKLSMDFTIEKIMTNWISKPGFPLVTVNVTEGLTSFCQTRFYSNPKSKASTPEYWYIPISYKTAKESNFTDTFPKFWLTPNEHCKWIDIKNSSWFIANTRQAGYYRVNYNQEHWNTLAKVLNSTKTRSEIHKINRAQLIDDAMNLAKAGVVPYGTAFNVTDYLLTEDDYFPWYSAFRSFRFLLQRYAQNSDTGKIVREYMKNITNTLVNGKDFSEPAKPETQIAVLNRVQALDWACNLGVKKCIDDAKKQFASIDKIPKNMRSIVYCTAVKNGNQADWDKLWKKYVSSNVAAEKVSIINALGCSTNKTILNNFLKKSIEGKDIRSQDASYVFSAVYSGTLEGVDVAFDFLKKYPEEIIKSYGGMNALDKAALGLAERLTKKEDIDKLKETLKSPFFDTIRDAALEVVKENVAWADLYGKDIGTLLTDRFNSATSLMISKMLMIFSFGFISIYLTKFA